MQKKISKVNYRRINKTKKGGKPFTAPIIMFIPCGNKNYGDWGSHFCMACSGTISQSCWAETPVAIKLSPKRLKMKNRYIPCAIANDSSFGHWGTSEECNKCEIEKNCKESTSKKEIEFNTENDIMGRRILSKGW